MSDRPPLGVMPRFLWEERRLDDLVSAMDLRLLARQEIPADWLTEYNELVRSLIGRRT
ncbi:hypothetical protein I532_03955 [Brevibacillus borstelensis AK1]|uniref:Uncharacterized protein n=1 Tax=Brevibacillus borstelensis AK1 TaxID=1300222 RepID=M8DEG0_9BACL|nr:hypothetical protein I532_03955 [Brevibacillus borstelensis AK1]